MVSIGIVRTTTEKPSPIAQNVTVGFNLSEDTDFTPTEEQIQVRIK